MSNVRFMQWGESAARKATTFGETAQMKYGNNQHRRESMEPRRRHAAGTRGMHARLAFRSFSLELNGRTRTATFTDAILLHVGPKVGD